MFKGNLRNEALGDFPVQPGYRGFSSKGRAVQGASGILLTKCSEGIRGWLSLRQGMLDSVSPTQWMSTAMEKPTRVTQLDLSATLEVAC